MESAHMDVDEKGGAWGSSHDITDMLFGLSLKGVLPCKKEKWKSHLF